MAVNTKVIVDLSNLQLALRNEDCVFAWTQERVGLLSPFLPDHTLHLRTLLVSHRLLNGI